MKSNLCEIVYGGFVSAVSFAVHNNERFLNIQLSLPLKAIFVNAGGLILRALCEILTVSVRKDGSETDSGRR